MDTPWERFKRSVDRDEVARMRAVLDDTRNHDMGDPSFVAVTEALQDEIRTGRSPLNLFNEALADMDGVVWSVLLHEDRDRRCEAMAWALAEVLPAATHKWQKKSLVTLMARYLNVDSGHPVGPICQALVHACRNHPKEVGGAAWKWLAENLPGCVEAGVVDADEARRVLTLGHAGATKRVVAKTLEALGGRLEETTPPPPSETGSGGLPTVASIAAELGCAVPGAGETIVLEEEEGPINPSRLVHFGPPGSSDSPASLLSKDMPLEEAAFLALRTMDAVRGEWAGEWIGARRQAWRKNGKWLMVRLDRILIPQDPALSEPEFTPDILLDDFFGTMFDDHEEATVAILTTADGTVGLLWRGPGFHAGLDPDQADEQYVGLHGW